MRYFGFLFYLTRRELCSNPVEIIERGRKIKGEEKIAGASRCKIKLGKRSSEIKRVRVTREEIDTTALTIITRSLVSSFQQLSSFASR